MINPTTDIEFISQEEILERKLEIMKEKLNPLFEDYLKERLNSKTENVKKAIFWTNFMEFSLEERRLYRNYIFDFLRVENDFLKDRSDDIKQILELLKMIDEMSKMDKREIQAWFYNHTTPEIITNLA